MIEAHNLTKWYASVQAVDDLSFHVAKGTVLGLLGPNGAGKSTTMKMLTCYLPPTSGTARVAGFDILADSMQIRRHLGYMSESVPLYAEMRVRELLMFRAALRDIPRRQRRAAVDRAAQVCWLSQPENMMRRRVGELSRGYRQRVGLAEALLHDPPVLILDEPTLGLDPAQIRAMRELIRQLGRERTVILSSHILAEVEQTCDQIIILAGGRIVASGTTADLRRRVVGPSQVIVEASGAPAEQIAQACRELSGVRTVQSSPAGQWVRLEIEGEGEDLPSRLYELARQRGWTLRELRRRVASLEDFFVQITYQQSLTAPAAHTTSQEGRS